MSASITDNTFDDPRTRAPLVLGKNDFTTVTDLVCGVTENPSTPPIWFALFGISLSCLGLLGLSLAWVVSTGVGIWGNQIPVAWAWPIVNFVFWIGIGHAGTLISAILFLFRQQWRTSINRAAEAMTIFAVCAAGIFPAMHIGRVWLAFFLFPYGPNQYGLWPNFRSPLLWDVFAVSTYATVSIVFWYMGMIPDLATLRDRAKHPLRKLVYSVLAMGWRGSARHWNVYELAYLCLAGLATPLVLSVHSVVSFDFAVSQVPGWHTTIFPPYFVAGAIFGGFAMVATLLIPARAIYKLHDLITPRHFDNMARIILATGMIVGFAYGIEFFIAWYGANPIEQFAFINRAFGPYWWAYWTMIFCNVVAPQAFWFKAARKNLLVMWIVCMFVNVGMWFERFVIVVSSLARDFLPSAWHYYVPTWVDVTTFVGSFGLFVTLFLLFIRFLPVVALAEVKTVMPQAHEHLHHGHSHHGENGHDGPAAHAAGDGHAGGTAPTPAAAH